MSKIIRCKECGKRYENSIPRCPNCYLKTPLSPLKIAAIIGGALAVAGIIVALLILFPEPNYDGESSSVIPPSSSEAVSDITSSDEESSSSKTEPSSSSKPQSSSEKPSSSETSSVVGNKVPLTDSKDKAVTGYKDGKVYITYPYWLMKVADPNFTYTVSQYENTNLGYIDVKKNDDGSATYTVGSYNDYCKGCLVFSGQVKVSFMEIRQATSTITNIEYNDTFSEIKMHTTFTTIDEIEEHCAAMAITLGTQITTYQYMNIDVPLDCRIEFYSPDKTLLGSMVFPGATHTYYKMTYGK